MDPHTFRGQVVTASVVSMSYLHMDLWAHLETAPLKYFVGNAHDRITALVSDTVDDPLLVKMQTLAASGFQSEVEAAVVLAREAPWSTILIEQAHASGAQLMHRHAQLEAASLVCRATVHNWRTLFYRSVFEKQELRLTSLRDELLKQMHNTTYIGARQAYVAMLVEQCKSSRVHGDPWHHALRRAVIKVHGKQFAKLRASQVASLRHNASVLKEPEDSIHI